MRVVLKLGYRAEAGQELCADLGCCRLKLSCCGDESSIGEAELGADEALSYSYILTQGEGSVKRERGRAHSVPFSRDVDSILVVDRWCDISVNAPFCSSLFTDSIFRRKSPVYTQVERGAITVEARVPLAQPQHSVIMVGSCSQLGEWQVERGVVLADGDHPIWRTPPLEICEELLGSEFKFVLFNNLTGEIEAWELGDNRTFAGCEALGVDSIYLMQGEPLFETPAWRGSGVAIPLFSLRSEMSAGVGDFADLKLMVDWAAATGQQIIQILPINDTTMSGEWEDSYPYNANSIFALHPQYISLRDVGGLLDGEQHESFEREARRLNALPVIDYKGVNTLKTTYLRALYTQMGEATLSSDGYREFFDGNAYWLESYALYSLLRDRYSSVDFAVWGTDSLYSDELLSSYRTSHSHELGYYYFVQYHLHSQLLDARAYALSKGVAFKGDIPIGVSRTSVDVWVNPRLFRLDSQAGAPPDDFSVLGQNWGFPTYNWEEMSLDGYTWWRARFAKMAEYFDAYRIDHILGFFRIWEIPLDAVHGLLGHFNPAMPYTPEQMAQSYGFNFEPSHAAPAINDWLLDHLFGERAGEIAQCYFDELASGEYRFKAEYNTQVKISKSVECEELRDALMLLFTELLFVEDPYKKGCYHPRISAQSSYKYRAMNSDDKQRYDNLYNDFYYYRHNDFWRDEALKKLPVLISATDMLTCGEDLGMIPHSVPEVMEQEQILSLEIQRMPKEQYCLFGNPQSYPYLSVCTTSTHDMNPVRAWLREDRELSNRYFKEMLGLDCAMGDDAPASICEKIIMQHLASPSMWTILPLQDWLSIDEELRADNPEAERINVPSSSRHYWRYRMHITLEELMLSDKFNEKIRVLTAR